VGVAPSRRAKRLRSSASRGARCLEVNLGARRRKVGQRRRIRCVGLGLFRELRFLEKIGDQPRRLIAAVLAFGDYDHTVVAAFQFGLFGGPARAASAAFLPTDSRRRGRPRTIRRSRRRRCAALRARRRSRRRASHGRWQTARRQYLNPCPVFTSFGEIDFALAIGVLSLELESV